MSEAIVMGVEARCRISGLKGIITGKTEYINGCIQWLLRPPVDKDGKPVEGSWIDEAMLEVLGQGIAIKKYAQQPGCDNPAPTSYQG